MSRTFGAALGLFAVSLAVCPAASAGDPASCVITIQSVFLKKDTGEWVKVIEPDRQVDLVTEEAYVSFFNTAGRIPPGSYSNVRILISETVRFSGRDGFRKTREGGVSVLKGTARRSAELPGEAAAFREGPPTGTAGEEGEVRQTIDFDGADEDGVIEITGTKNFPSPLVIRKGSFIAVRLLFNLENTVHAGGGPWGRDVIPADAVYFLPPAVIQEIKVVVDTDSFTFDSAYAEMIF